MFDQVWNSVNFLDMTLSYGRTLDSHILCTLVLSVFEELFLVEVMLRARLLT